MEFCENKKTPASKAGVVQKGLKTYSADASDASSAGFSAGVSAGFSAEDSAAFLFLMFALHILQIIDFAPLISCSYKTLIPVLLHTGHTPRPRFCSARIPLPL